MHVTTRLLLLLSLLYSARPADVLGDGLINLSPLAGMVGSAATDGARSAVRINDGKPETYWSAWPYTMSGDEDVITLDVLFPLPVHAHHIEMDGAKRWPEMKLAVREDAKWRDIEVIIRWDNEGCRISWGEPLRLDAMRFRFERIRAEQSGVVIHEMRVMGKLHPGISIGEALSEEETPDLDWEPVTTYVSIKEGPGDAQNKWFEASPAEAVSIHRVEMDWDGADYARRTVLDLVMANGQRVLVPRLQYSTSFTFDEPQRVQAVRVHCTQVGPNVRLKSLRLYGEGKEPSPPENPQVALWAESALLKVSPDTKWPDPRSPFKPGDPLRISLVRGEYESGQVVLRNDGDRILRDVTVTVESPDRLNQTAVLAKAYPMAFVNGRYGDVILPEGSFSVPADSSRPVWVRVMGSDYTVAGISRADLVCRVAGEKVASLPLEVEMWEPRLDRETHFKTHYFSIWGTGRWLQDRLNDSDEREAMLEEITWQFMEHRISPGSPFIMEDYEKLLMAQKVPFSSFMQEFDRRTQSMLPRMPFVGLIPENVPGLPGAPEDEEAYLRYMQDHLERRGWLDRFAIRVGDEPPPGNRRVTERAKHIKQVAPKLRRQCAFSSFGVGGTATWAGLIDEYGINPRVYNDDRIEDVVAYSQKREAAGDGVSWYVHQALGVEQPPYYPRAYFWWLWKHRIDGVLLYGVSEWQHREVDRWEDDFVIHGDGFKSWGVLLWPAKGKLLESTRFEAVRDGIEDWELHRQLDVQAKKLAELDNDHPLLARAREILDATERVIVAFNADEAHKASPYRIQDRHADSPILCMNARPADLLDARRELVGILADVSREVRRLEREKPEGSGESRTSGHERPIPEWAKQYTDGLRAWRDIIYYWLDRQEPDGTFGFGWGEDCEMIVGWPGVMMAADDRRIEAAIERLADNRWFNPSIQQGYVYLATDPEHGAEPMSYTHPVLLYQKFGSPKLIERLMIGSKNVEQWTGITPHGDRHMRSTYFGSQQMREWEFYGEDSPINARAWIPMMHLLIYNRDPHLMDYFLEWTSAWAKHAMATDHGKPPGFLPGSVEFATGEPGGYTNNWWGAGAHEFSSLWYHTRLYGMLTTAYYLTGHDKFIKPQRELMRFLSTYAKPKVEKGEPLPPDRLPEEYSFGPGWREGDLSTRWARDVALGHPGRWYAYVTGDRSFDDAFEALLGESIVRGPFEEIDKKIVAQSSARAVSMRDKYFDEVVPKLKYGGSTANYAAAWWQKGYGTMTFGNRCFGDGSRLANSVNWPWVDFPPPAVTWKDTGYETGIFVLEDSPRRFRAALCNVAEHEREIGAQLFTLDEGTYYVNLWPYDENDPSVHGLGRHDETFIERGTIVRIPLPPRVTMLLVMHRKGGEPAPGWRAKPDLALDPWDVMISKEQPQAGDKVAITVRVHNIGSQRAEHARVLVGSRLDDEMVWFAERDMGLLHAPQKLEPSWRDTRFEYTVTSGEETLVVRLDYGDETDELCETNNEVEVAIGELKTSQPEKKSIVHPPARKPSLDDIDTANCSRYHVVRREGITLDGVIGDVEWEGVEAFAFLPHAENGEVRKKTWMRVAYDDEAMYLGLMCEEPDLQWLDTDLPHPTDIYYNDGFEIFLDPGAQVWRYWQFVFDTVPVQFQTKTRNQYAKQVAWDVAVHKGDDFYSAEVRFPFDPFDVPAPKPGDRWRMNVMRFTTTFRDPDNPDRRISERSHFSPKGGLHNHHDVAKFGDIIFE